MFPSSPPARGEGGCVLTQTGKHLHPRHAAVPTWTPLRCASPRANMTNGKSEVWIDSMHMASLHASPSLLTCVFHFAQNSTCQQSCAGSPVCVSQPLPPLQTAGFVCFLSPSVLLQLTSSVSLVCVCVSSLGTERLPWSTWTPWRACEYKPVFYRHLCQMSSS